MPSAIRLYVIGSQAFGQAVDNSLAMIAINFAIVLSAEVEQVVFSLALATLGDSTRELGGRGSTEDKFISFP